MDGSRLVCGRLVLRTDELIEQQNAFASSNGDVALAHSPAIDPDKRTSRCEQGSDFRRSVREEVSDVAILLDALQQRPTHSIDRSRSIRVDEALQQLSRVGRDQARLPCVERHISAVLWADVMLREETDPVFPVAVYLDAALLPHESSPSVRHAQDYSNAVLDKARVARVLENP